MSTRLVIPVLFSVLVSGGAATSASAAERVLAGTVVDQSGHAVPRAYVRVLDASGTEQRGVFADEAGRFALAATDAGDCRVPLSDTNEQCYEKTTLSSNPAILPRCLVWLKPGHYVRRPG